MRPLALEVDGRHVEAAEWPGDGDRAPLVVLHEGLGSVGLLRGFPEALAAATGRRVVAYSRPGHGRSAPPAEPRTAAFYPREAHEVLPAVLRAVSAERPILVGHSDGASIALIHAAHHPVTGAVLIAPHTYVEEAALAGIRRTRSAFRDGDLRERMARHHDDVAHVFWSWADLWLDPGFAGWDIGADAAALRVPTLLIQGDEDDYATPAQLDRIATLAPAPMERVELAAGHSPHLDAPEETVTAIASFVADLA